MSRSDEGLAGAAADLEMLGSSDPATGDSTAELEVANLLTVGTLITHAAWLRTESRGCHFRRDFPWRRDESWTVRIVQQRDEPPVRVGVEGHMMRWSGAGGPFGGLETPQQPIAPFETE
jgi:succinate dehydrogenase/fumarate reductase flavoprotein subunit